MDLQVQKNGRRKNIGSGGAKKGILAQAVESEPNKCDPVMTNELRRLGAALGREFVWAVLTDKERDIILEKGLGRSEPGRRSCGRALDRECDIDRGR